MERELVYKVFGILVALFAIGIFIFAWINHSGIKGIIEKEISKYGLTILFSISFFLEFIPQYVSPHIGLFSASLLGLNLIDSFFIITIGSSLGSFLGFEVGKKIRNTTRFAEEVFGEKASKSLGDKLNKRGKWIIAVAAISPLPYIPMIIGMLNLTRKNFIVYGIIPRVLGFLIVSLIAWRII